MKPFAPKISCAAVAAILFTLLGTQQASAQTLVADWSFNNPGMGKSPSLVDSVGGHTFLNSYAGGVNGAASSSIGGPSNNPSYFANGGYYGVAAGTTVLPTNDYTLSLYAQEPAAYLTSNSILFSTSGGNRQDVQIGILNGMYVAYYDTSGNNFVSSSSAVTANANSILIGAFAATTADAHLSVTDINGIYTFSDNGVNDPSVNVSLNPLTITSGSGYATSFSAPHAGVAPGGGGPNYTGYMSDITVTAGVTSLPVPEPSTYVMMGLGLLGLVALLRSRRSNA